MRRNYNVWQVWVAIAALVVTLGLAGISAAGNEHDEMRSTTQRVQVIEHKDEFYDALVQKRSDQLADIQSKLAAQGAVLEEIKRLCMKRGN